MGYFFLTATKSEEHHAHCCLHRSCKTSALLNPFASEAVYTRNFFSDRMSDSVRPEELGRKPCQHATRGCDKRWMTCIHAGVSRSPREHASVPPDKRHCRQGMSERNGMSEWIFA